MRATRKSSNYFFLSCLLDFDPSRRQFCTSAEARNLFTVSTKWVHQLDKRKNRRANDQSCHESTSFHERKSVKYSNHWALRHIVVTGHFFTPERVTVVPWNSWVRVVRHPWHRLQESFLNLPCLMSFFFSEILPLLRFCWIRLRCHRIFMFLLSWVFARLSLTFPFRLEWLEWATASSPFAGIQVKLLVHIMHRYHVSCDVIPESSSLQVDSMTHLADATSTF